MARRQIDDAYSKRARREGYAARSAYKLLQIQEKWKIIQPGDRVLDLGCAPGSWLQVAAKLTGPKGAVAGVDLQRVKVSAGANVRTIEGDAFDLPPEELLALAGLGPDDRFDVLLSDMAPRTSGDPRSDSFLSIRLAEGVLDLARALLKPWGPMVVKVFEGEAYPEFLQTAARSFKTAKGFRPKATRDVSREMFVIARGFQPPKMDKED